MIRPALDADLLAIQAIYAHHVLTGLATFEINPPGVEEIARRRSDILGRGLPYLVAEIDGAVAGYAYAGAYRPRPAYQYTVEDSVYIHPGHQRRGLGRMLLTELISRCQAADRRQMIAVIGDSANAASIKLHEAMGFRHVGVLEGVGFKFGRWVDTVLMQRTLNSGRE